MSASAIFAELRFPRLDPVLLDLPGPIDVRWYSLMYLAGFAVAFLVLRQLAHRGELQLSASAAGDLLGVLVMGVILGGRLGYLLFYGLGGLRRHPLEALRIWEGGMSFHGGLLGVIIAALWYARRHGLRFLHLADALALATPFGLFAVRLANFVNGELYGRLAAATVPWAVRFPTDPVALRLMDATELPLRARERRIIDAYGSGAWDAIRPQVPLRHPSQLYEALAEGLLLGLLLWGVLRRRRRAGGGVASLDGRFAGTFLVAYGIARVVIEQFRQPDAQFQRAGNALGTVLGPFTMGQLLSSAMIIAGVAVIARRQALAAR